MGNSGAINPRRLLHRRRKLYGLLSFILRETKYRVLVEAGLPTKRRAGRQTRAANSPGTLATIKDRFVLERGAFPRRDLLSIVGSVLYPTRKVTFFLTQTTTEIDTWCAWGSRSF